MHSAGNSKYLILLICSKIKGEEKLSGNLHSPEARKGVGGHRGKGSINFMREGGYHIVSWMEICLKDHLRGSSKSLVAVPFVVAWAWKTEFLLLRQRKLYLIFTIEILGR